MGLTGNIETEAKEPTTEAEVLSKPDSDEWMASDHGGRNARSSRERKFQEWRTPVEHKANQDELHLWTETRGRLRNWTMQGMSPPKGSHSLLWSGFIRDFKPSHGFWSSTHCPPEFFHARTEPFTTGPQASVLKCCTLGGYMTDVSWGQLGQNTWRYLRLKQLVLEWFEELRNAILNFL